MDENEAATTSTSTTAIGLLSAAVLLLTVCVIVKQAAAHGKATRTGGGRSTCACCRLGQASAAASSPSVRSGEALATTDGHNNPRNSIVASSHVVTISLDDGWKQASSDGGCGKAATNSERYASPPSASPPSAEPQVATARSVGCLSQCSPPPKVEAFLCRSHARGSAADDGSCSRGGGAGQASKLGSRRQHTAGDRPGARGEAISEAEYAGEVTRTARLVAASMSGHSSRIKLARAASSNPARGWASGTLPAAGGTKHMPLAQAASVAVCGGGASAASTRAAVGRKDCRAISMQTQGSLFAVLRAHRSNKIGLAEEVAIESRVPAATTQGSSSLAPLTHAGWPAVRSSADGEPRRIDVERVKSMDEVLLILSRQDMSDRYLSSTSGSAAAAAAAHHRVASQEIYVFPVPDKPGSDGKGSTAPLPGPAASQGHYLMFGTGLPGESHL